MNMKLKIALALSCVFVGAVVFSAYPMNGKTSNIPKLNLPQIGEEINIQNVSFDTAIANEDQDAIVYRCVPCDAAEVRSKISELTGSDVENVEDFPSATRISDTESIGFDEVTGRWFYRTDIDFTETASVPDDETSIQIAYEYIKQHDLYPVSELGEPQIGTVTTGDELLGEEKIIRKNVTYYPLIDGRPVYGQFKIKIGIGDRGKVVAVDKFATEVEAVSSVATKEASNIQNSILEDDNCLISTESTGSDVTITDTAIGYYADVESPFIQPVFVLEGEFENQEELTILVDAQE